MTPPRPLAPDLPPALGVHLVEDGAVAAVYAGHADAVELCLLDQEWPASPERRVVLEHQVGGVHFGHVPGVEAGQRYGLRAHGAWDPARGQRHNPDKLLLDPYARGLGGSFTWAPQVFGHTVGADLAGDPDTRDTRDSARFVPHGVVLADGFDWRGDAPPRVPWTDTVVYEAHVRGLTQRLPGVPHHLRGTYAGLAHPATVAHLVDLGVTTVELLPVHAFIDEPALARRGLTNYWGYNTLGFFAPHGAYAAATDAAGVLDEVKAMVRSLHAAGLEVVLDVVYNHTCEQGRDGAMLSWRGLDSRSYYRLDEQGRDIDVTGCGNTLDFSNARVVQLALDSLRYWVRDCHVDGFRFDLAPALARGRDEGFDADHPFLVALRADPVLGRVKLIAEPWDIGPHGWRTGQFPAPMTEWNDRFRDGVRTFWLADQAAAQRGAGGHGVRDVALRLSGSDDLFDGPGRGPLASVNFVAAHDGFTLADTTAYEHKHNLGNGEGNRDGHGDNRSWNHGVEGPTDDPSVLEARRRSMRNLLGTVLLSSGVPMLCAGDELGRTQRGNNNAYCRDDELSWLSWELADWQHDLLATTRHLLRLRREHPVLRPGRFFSARPTDPGVGDSLSWFTADGHPMDDRPWQDAGTTTVQALYDGTSAGGPGRAGAGGQLLIVLHGGSTQVQVQPPGDRSYRLLWHSAHERPQDGNWRPRGEPLTLVAASMAVLEPDAPPPRR